MNPSPHLVRYGAMGGATHGSMRPRAPERYTSTPQRRIHHYDYLPITHLVYDYNYLDQRDINHYHTRHYVHHHRHHYRQRTDNYHHDCPSVRYNMTQTTRRPHTTPHTSRSTPQRFRRATHYSAAPDRYAVQPRPRLSISIPRPHPRPAHTAHTAHPPKLARPEPQVQTTRRRGKSRSEIRARQTQESMSYEFPHHERRHFPDRR